ncbi:hypothetical protein D3C75_1316630 [compost metagenome]
MKSMVSLPALVSLSLTCRPGSPGTTRPFVLPFNSWSESSSWKIADTSVVNALDAAAFLGSTIRAPSSPFFT